MNSYSRLKATLNKIITVLNIKTNSSSGSTEPKVEVMFFLI